MQTQVGKYLLLKFLLHFGIDREKVSINRANISIGKHIKGDMILYEF